MSVGRRAARLATVCVFLGGLVTLGAAPAHADEDRVRVRSAGSFTAGRAAQDVRLEVRKRTDGCVRVRGALGLSLPGVRPEQVAVQAEVDRRWVSVPVSGADGLVTTAPVAPARDELCKRKGTVLRFRVAFGAEAPGGRLVVTGEAVTARGVLLGRAVAESRVNGGRVAPSPSPSPSPSPTLDEVVETPPAPTATVALAVDSPGEASQAANQSGGISSVMYVGIAMVAAGALLIGLLVFRSRRDRRQRGEQADVPLPGNPGGTTYRSTRSSVPTQAGPQVLPPPGPQAVPPPAPGQVYGTGRPPTPRVYGGGTPTARPTGGLYGARPTGAGDQSPAAPAETAPAGSATAPPVSSPAAVPPVSGSATVPPVSGSAAVPPVQGGSPGWQDPPPPAAAGDDPRYGGGLPG
ncbi:hypothetical protein GCM10009541_29040 [Micromonospora gifhornensis]|uniref:Uncharacterized protein n=1 Tax=Micromonospora gifhornensis TaxID=84594 RepID=A0ABQ4I8L4_9ACTN|nr:hypothetical protein [Micromonospora gifhornensis]GIJ14136.1 hypothetical protein Vgi01_08200 [Micromonospora gifhornensis]